MRKSHKSIYEPFPELEMPTLAFCVLLFYDFCCSKCFQCPVALSTVQVQRLRIINGANFVGKVMALNLVGGNLGKKQTRFLNPSPSSHFCTVFEMVFGAPKLCSFSQPRHMPLLPWHLSMGPSPLTSSRLPQALTVWRKACVRPKSGVRC